MRENVEFRRATQDELRMQAAHDQYEDLSTEIVRAGLEALMEAERDVC